MARSTASARNGLTTIVSCFTAGPSTGTALPPVPLLHVIVPVGTERVVPRARRPAGRLFPDDEAAMTILRGALGAVAALALWAGAAHAEYNPEKENREREEANARRREAITDTLITYGGGAASLVV